MAIPANVSNTLGSGRHGGWSLVILVEDPNEPFRNLSVFDGFQQINPSNPVDITVSGFLSPPSGPVLAEVGFLTYEGDEFYTGDYAQFNGTQLGDAVNSTTNFFNSRITDGGAYVSTKNPDYYDQLGFDAKVINTVGIVSPGDTSATVQLRSAGDWYYNGLVTTAIDIYVPNLVLDLQKSVIDLNGGDVHPGDTLEYHVTFSNQGDDAALDTILTDAIPAGTTYVPGSARINTGDNPGTANAVYSSGSNSLAFYMGTGASPGTGGRVAPESITGTVYDVEFQVTVDTAAAGSTVDNVATLAYTAETIGDSFTADTPAASSPVVALSNLVFDQKIDTVDPVVAGAATVYQLDVTNEGPSPAENVTITDTLPVGFAFDAVASSAGCSVTGGTPPTGQTVACDLGTLAASDSDSATIAADVLGDTAANTVTNSATVATTTA